MSDTKYSIRNKESRAIVDGWGAYIESWRIGEQSIIVAPDENKLKAEESQRCGIPICFPNFGPETVFEGVSLPRHGIWRKRYFSQLGMRLDGSGIQYEARLSEGALAYDVMALYQLLDEQVLENHIENGLRQEIRVKGGGAGPMPLCVGFHPYLKVDKHHFSLSIDGAQVIVGVDAGSWIENFRTAQEYLLKDACELALDKYSRLKIKLEGDFISGGQRLYVWSESDDYICIEPVMHDPNKFGSADGYYVDAGEYKKFVVTYTVMTNKY